MHARGPESGSTYWGVLQQSPSGQGELNAVARLGGKLYLLGSYDVETAAPKLALVRIHE